MENASARLSAFCLPPSAFRLLTSDFRLLTSPFVGYNPSGELMQSTTAINETVGLLARIEARERLSLEEWKAVEDLAPTEELGRLADELRKTLHPDDVVTYVVDRNVNYSNVCVSVCTFCAFYR